MKTLEDILDPPKKPAAKAKPRPGDKPAPIVAFAVCGDLQVAAAAIAAEHDICDSHLRQIAGLTRAATRLLDEIRDEAAAMAQRIKILPN